MKKITKEQIKDLKKNFILLKKIELESENFKINSTGWERVIDNQKDILINKKGDVKEIVGGKYDGEQLFTWRAAMRETKKVEKRIPTDEEFRCVDDDDLKKSPPVGYRDANNFYSCESLLSFLWTSTKNKTGNWKRYLHFEKNKNKLDISRYMGSEEYGLSVRCIKK